MVMQEMSPPRQAFVLKRGQYDQPGEAVAPHVPAVLPPLPAGAPANRLGLARWLVDPGHPLTARVAVNRCWQMYFGNGIVETVEDFGSQGAVADASRIARLAGAGIRGQRLGLSRLAETDRDVGHAIGSRRVPMPLPTSAIPRICCLAAARGFACRPK